MTTPIISQEEFKKIHSAYCEMVAIKQQLEGLIHPSITERLEAACGSLLSGIQQTLDSQDAQEEKDQERASVVAEQLGVKSVWSMKLPDSFDEYAFEGVSLLRYRDTTMRVSSPIRWSSLWIAADLLIFSHHPTDHIFIEDFKLSADGSYIELHTGS